MAWQREQLQTHCWSKGSCTGRDIGFKLHSLPSGVDCGVVSLSRSFCLSFFFLHLLYSSLLTLSLITLRRSVSVFVALLSPTSPLNCIFFFYLLYNLPRCILYFPTLISSSSLNSRSFPFFRLSQYGNTKTIILPHCLPAVCVQYWKKTLLRQTERWRDGKKTKSC